MKNNTKYVDGFVLAVPQKNLDKYKKMASQAGKIWIKYGALEYKECLMDDPVPNKMIKLTFPKLTKVKKGETIWFSYIVYKSKKHRDEINAKVMKDAEMNKEELKEMPFDMKRMAYGGFEVVVDY